jgi:hypothetical protein
LSSTAASSATSAESSLLTNFFLTHPNRGESPWPALHWQEPKHAPGSRLWLCCRNHGPSWHLSVSGLPPPAPGAAQSSCFQVQSPRHARKHTHTTATAARSVLPRGQAFLRCRTGNRTEARLGGSRNRGPSWHLPVGGLLPPALGAAQSSCFQVQSLRHARRHTHNGDRSSLGPANAVDKPLDAMLPCASGYR